jgi:hypothetical protein
MPIKVSSSFNVYKNIIFLIIVTRSLIVNMPSLFTRCPSSYTNKYIKNNFAGESESLILANKEST